MNVRDGPSNQPMYRIAVGIFGGTDGDIASCGPTVLDPPRKYEIHFIPNQGVVLAMLEPVPMNI